jgi:iron complex outermembrane receptor protein
VNVGTAWTLNGGVRYTNDDKNFPGARVETTPVTPTGRLTTAVRSVANNPSFSKVTWTVGANYKPSTNILAYGKVATGYKAGGSEQGITYQPETVTGFEAGLKTSLFERMLTLNLAAFYNDYKDLQVAKTVNALTLVENAATAKTQGIELEAALATTNGFKINAGVSLLKAEYGSYLDATDPRNALTAAQRAAGLRGPDLSGNDLPAAPQLDFIASIEKEFVLGDNTLTPRVDFHHSSRYWGTEFNNFGAYGVLGQKPYTRIDASLAFASGNGWSARVWGQNLSDEDIQTFSAIGGNGNLIGSYSDPRTYGVSVSFDF